jgi:hypothetical protein
MSETTVNVLLSIALAVVSGVLTILGAWAKQKYNAEQLRTYEKKASTIVSAAEQVGALAGWDGSKKKQYALDLLVKMGLKPEQASAFIESAVSEMTKWNGQLMLGPDGSTTLKTPICPPVT